MADNNIRIFITQEGGKEVAGVMDRLASSVIKFDNAAFQAKEKSAAFFKNLQQQSKNALIAQQQLRKAGKDLATAIDARQPTAQLRELGLASHQGFITLQQGAKTTGLSVSALSKQLRKMNLEVINVGGKPIGALNKLTGAVQPLGKAVEKAAQNARRFRMEFLSLLFAGQAISRIFKQIAFSSVKTFQEIAGETNPANRAIATLSANFKFLKFSIGSAIGEALIPLLPKLTEITQTIVDFIDQHPEGVAGFIIGGIATGVMASFAASFVLLANSISTIAQDAPIAAKALGKIGKITIAGIAVTFGVSLLDFEVTGKFNVLEELTGALLVGIGAGILTGNVVVGIVAGILTFTVGTAIKFLIDPKSLGAAVADYQNFFAKLLEKVLPIAVLTVKLLSNPFLLAGVIAGKVDISKITEPIKDFGGKVQEGYQEEIADLFKNNELSDQLAERNREMIENAFAQSFPDDAFINTNFKENLKDALTISPEVTDSWQNFGAFSTNLLGNLITLLSGKKGIGEAIGLPTKGSFPLVYSLIQAEQEFRTLGVVGSQEIQKIINELNSIPREIVTVHRIITVNV